MSTSKKPAFPFNETIEHRDGVNIIRENRQHPGMTLRQWYAGKALQGFCANFEYLKTHMAGCLERKQEPESQLAKCCLDLADAMIEEGEK